MSTNNLLTPSNLSKTETKIHKRFLSYMNPTNDSPTVNNMRHLIASKYTGEDKYLLYNATVNYITSLLKLNNIKLVNVIVNSGLDATLVSAFYKPENRTKLTSTQLNTFIKYLPTVYASPSTLAEQYREASQTSNERTKRIEKFSNAIQLNKQPNENASNNDTEISNIYTAKLYNRLVDATLHVKLNSKEEVKQLEDFYNMSLSMIETSVQNRITLNNIVNNS